ncbi:pseudouridine synthase [Microbacterium sp. zg.Y1090]|uniref:pseudouridine synthase n=1 Tax=Microbacterium TaxID=33882 RepID=UPI00214A9043|nr:MULTISPECIES: pseudouridine synthase [unclassified Microbacterium]MCR2812213.1 pseudouridine synthase [Microbacterium sp. zg.Y1084]MCR2818349.1 pseudouridine synthase [Microbacterium sp. zg.Y1090]MDL5486161.1 pseudouridine synthase [Microbacterium sp. zg-Y1211]WIM29368.1 pseudouridine synthase [Microbacterium sp. zg-Y1090]
MPVSPRPVRDGVGATRLRVPVTGPWPTIADYVVERFDHLDTASLHDRFDRGDVVDAAGAVVRRDTPLGAAEFIWYHREPPAAERTVPFDEEILHLDDDLVVIDKPHYLPTTPGGRFLNHTALVRLRRRLDNPDLVPIHRLDRATAGVLMFSARPATRGAYQSLFERREVQKTYEAVSALPADGLPPFPLVHRSHIQKFRDSLCVQTRPDLDPNAETLIELIRTGTSGGGHAGLPVVHTRLRPRTGRMHQLRVHLAQLGLGILGDRYYPELLPETPEDDPQRPMQLLAAELRFTDPLTGRPRVFTTRRRLADAPPRA